MVVSSEYPVLKLPETDLFTFLFDKPRLPFQQDKVIYQDADNLNRQYTYADVRILAQNFGQCLASQYGLRKGERVAVLTPNDIDYPPVVFGILWAGAVACPINPAYTVSEVVYQLKDSGAKLVVAHHQALDTVKQACSEVGLSEKDILVLGHPSSTSGNVKHWRNAAQTSTNSNQQRVQRPRLDPKNDLAFLVYSSGTTGRPKGVMLTHYNIVANVCQITACEAGKLSSTGSKHFPGIPDAPPDGDKILACLPYFHIYGLTSLIMSPLHNGIHTIVLAKFEIEHFCRLVQDNKITFVYIVPPQALLLAKHACVPNYDLSTIRMTNSGAAPLTKELQSAVFARTGIRIKQGYGLSETSPTTHEQRWEDWNTNIGTIGKLQPNMQAKFCPVRAEGSTNTDANTSAPEELPTGEIGELYVRGPNVFKGYWNNLPATLDCLDTKEGWFRTGDIGYVNAKGDFFITDRAKELIKYKGFQVAPAEIEGYLLDHPLIDDVAVVGVNSRRLGTEIPRALVVRKGGMDAVRSGDEKLITEWLGTKVVAYKRLRGGVKFVEAIPKTASGKLLRRLVRDEARAEYARMEMEEEEQNLKAKL